MLLKVVTFDFRIPKTLGGSIGSPTDLISMLLLLVTNGVIPNFIRQKQVTKSGNIFRCN